MDLPPPPNHSPCPPISTSFFHSLEKSLCGKTPTHTQKLADPIPNPPKSEKVPSIPTNSSQSCTSNLSHFQCHKSQAQHKGTPHMHRKPPRVSPSAHKAYTWTRLAQAGASTYLHLASPAACLCAARSASAGRACPFLTATGRTDRRLTPPRGCGAGLGPQRAAGTKPESHCWEHSGL